MTPIRAVAWEILAAAVVIAVALLMGVSCHLAIPLAPPAVP